MWEYQRQKGLLLAVKRLNFVCRMSCRVLQKLKLSMANIMGWGNVGRERRSVVRMMANISARYEPLMGDGTPCVQCSTLAKHVTNPLSQSQWTIIEGHHDPLLCANVSERGCQEPSQSVTMDHY